MGEVGTQEWAARRGAGGSARSVVGPASRACASEGERVRRFGGKKISAGTVRGDPDFFSEVGAAMMGLFKVNGVGTLWLPGNDEVMAKEVGAVMIVWELWHGKVT